MTDTETPMPTINSFYDNETSTEYAVEDTVARARAEAAQEAAEAAQEAAGAGIVTDPVWVQHRNTYRGQYLGDSYTDEQKAMVAAGTFDDLYIGDYWTINNHDWIVADINYWLDTGDTQCEEPHLVIVPKNSIDITKMNDTNTTNGAYLSSKMYTQGLNASKTLIYSSFGESNILNHRSYLPNSASNGSVTSVIFTNSKVDLMNQIMVVGSCVFPGYFANNVRPLNATIEKEQLSLFRLNPVIIIGTYWLRDIASSENFTAIDYRGFIREYAPTTSIGVRPAFGLIG